MQRNSKLHRFCQIIVLFAVIALVFHGCSNPAGEALYEWFSSGEEPTTEELLELLLGSQLNDNGDGTFTIPADWDGRLLIPDGFQISPENPNYIEKTGDGEDEKSYLCLDALPDGEKVSLVALGLTITIEKNGDETVITLPGDLDFVIIKEDDGSFTLKKTDSQLLADYMASLVANLQDEYVKNQDGTWSLDFLYDERITLPLPDAIFPGDLIVTVNGEPVDGSLPLDIEAGEPTEIVIKLTLNKEEDSVTLLVTRGPFIPITRIILLPPGFTLKLGGEQQEASYKLTVKIEPENATRPSELQWISSDPEVAKVDNGTVTAISAGTAEITAISKNQEDCLPLVTSNSVVITVVDLGVVVPVPVRGIALSPTELDLTTGHTYALSIEWYPENATNKTVSWVSSDDTVATVSDGLVTAVGGGSATITVTTADGEYTATCAVKVTVIKSGDNTVDEFIVSSGQLSGVAPNFTLNIGTGETVTLNFNKPLGATALCEAGSVSDSFDKPEERSCEFTLDNLEVDDTDITITITAEDGGKKVYTITVKREAAPETIPVTEIKVIPGSLTLTVGGEAGSLTAIVTPQNATTPAVRWDSSNNSVATVDQLGNVTAVAAGTVTITASATDGSEKSGSAEVKVTVLSQDASLGDLRVNDKAVSGTSPDFFATVENTVATVTVSFTKDAKATAVYKNALPDDPTIVIDKSSFTVNLATDINVFEITVTAENGDSVTYRLTITRLSEPGSGTIILEWDNTGQTLISPDGVLTLSRQAGGKVTLTGPDNAGTYMWIIDANYRNPVSRTQSYTFDSADWAIGKYNVSLWVGTLIGGDTVEIIVVQ